MKCFQCCLSSAAASTGHLFRLNLSPTFGLCFSATADITCKRQQAAESNLVTESHAHSLLMAHPNSQLALSTNSSAVPCSPDKAANECWPTGKNLPNPNKEFKHTYSVVCSQEVTQLLTCTLLPNSSENSGNFYMCNLADCVFFLGVPVLSVARFQHLVFGPSPLSLTAYRAQPHKCRKECWEQVVVCTRGHRWAYRVLQ